MTWAIYIMAVVIFGQCILVGRLLGDVGVLNFKLFEMAENIESIKKTLSDNKEPDNWNKSFELELNRKRRKTDK